eukprot:6206354-Pleurochrysis_carterae.AAC.6
MSTRWTLTLHFALCAAAVASRAAGPAQAATHAATAVATHCAATAVAAHRAARRIADRAAGLHLAHPPVDVDEHAHHLRDARGAVVEDARPPLQRLDTITHRAHLREQ